MTERTAFALGGIAIGAVIGLGVNPTTIWAPIIGMLIGVAAMLALAAIPEGRDAG